MSELDLFGIKINLNKNKEEKTGTTIMKNYKIPIKDALNKLGYKPEQITNIRIDKNNIYLTEEIKEE